MKKTITVLMVITMLMTLLFTGCSAEKQKVEELSDGDAVGKGKITFQLNIVDDKENLTQADISTNEEFLGDALQELGIISGEESAYGLYITKVNGLYADYDNDKTYWALYVKDKYAESSIDKIEITDGGEYTLKFEKNM